MPTPPQRRIRLRGQVIYDVYGADRVDLNGPFTPGELAARLISEWVLLPDCGKCGRFDTCKFVTPAQRNGHANRRQQCGVMAMIIRELVARCWPLLMKSTQKKRQYFLDGAFHMATYVFKSEQHIGNLIDDDFLDWMGNLAPVGFGLTTRYRYHLDRAAENWRHFEELGASQRVILVEGASEFRFLTTLAKSREIGLLEPNLHNYGGSGNMRPTNLRLLVERYTQMGYRVYIQGDADGRPRRGRFDALINKGLVVRNRAFAFSHDFENAVPLNLAWFALKFCELPISDSEKTFLQRMRRRRRPLLLALSEEYGIQLDNRKVAFAGACAEILLASATMRAPSAPFWKSELGRFVTFARRAR